VAVHGRELIMSPDEFLEMEYEDRVSGGYSFEVEDLGEIDFDVDELGEEEEGEE
jgi:hypothetical protein